MKLPMDSSVTLLGSNVMDQRIVDCLINSISRFIHLVACQNVKNTPVLKNFRNLVGVLKLLKSVLDEYLESQVPFDEQLFKTFEKLDIFINEARDVLEKLPQRTSTIFNVLRCGPSLMKVLRSSMESCSRLRSLLVLYPSDSLLACLQYCIQELQCADQDQISELIEFTLRDKQENVTPNREFVMKIAEFLGLMSNKELLMESIALEKEREKAEHKKNKDDIVVIYQLIDLMKQIRSLMKKLEQFGVINGFSIPPYFRCPLSLELMLDPVILASGQTYERSFIQKWLDHGLKICPVTRQILFHTNLVPNDTVKALITNWCEENGIWLCHPIETTQMSCSPIGSGAASSGNGFHVSKNNDSATRSLHEVPNGLEELAVDVSFENSKNKDSHVNHHPSKLQVLPLGCNTSVEQQSYIHCRNDSLSSVNSTTGLLSKSENSGNLSECATFASNKDLSAWLSSSESHCTKLGNDRGLGTHSSPSPSCSGSDNACTSFHVKKLVEDLKSQSTELQIEAALELRFLARDNMENRVLIAKCGAIAPLVSLLYSKVKLTQENTVTALLNLSICDSNKAAIAEAGAMEPLIHVLKCGNTVAKENSAAALFSLSIIEEYKIKIGRSDAVKPLVDLLNSGTLRGKKDAAAALFNLSIIHENKARIIQAGAVRYLVELLVPETSMVDKAVALLANLSTIPEGCSAVAQEGGIPLLVEVVESGSQRGKENAASVLLQLCINSPKYSGLVLQEGAVPPLIGLAQQGTPRAKEKAQQILSHFRSLREGAVGKRRS